MTATNSHGHGITLPAGLFLTVKKRQVSGEVFSVTNGVRFIITPVHAGEDVSSFTMGSKDGVTDGKAN